ncbi:MAG: MarR family transcriptional regulator [Alphaproteobacteria bacterium]
MNESAQYFGYRLGEVARLWRTELDQRLRPLGLSQARGIALLHLAKPGPPLTQNELAERARIRGSTLARQLDLLEADGLIERRECAWDRRVKTVHLTDRARPLIAQVETVARQLRREVLADVTAAEVRACLSVFDRAKERLTAGTAAEPNRRQTG